MSVSKLRTILDRILHFGGYGCSDTDRLLFEFVEGELDPETQTRLEHHVSDCPPCLEYIKTYRRTIHLTHTHCHADLPMPSELEQKLIAFIQQNVAAQ